ncbi:class I SAM-dependent methyltransferase [Candidatus Saccharibacteria bacterium]|nr:class I SAM-dependent methyltransferase [Candidatus Saccharibacteria bacterium]
MSKYNQYDHFAADKQQRLIKGQSLPHSYVEKPAMRKMLPDLLGQKVLMLGCGTGEESRLLEEKGAAELVGIDKSTVSIELAKKTYPGHTFRSGDINDLVFDNESFDFVYSSLAINYTGKPKNVYKEAYRVLKKGGKFQFSVPHPVRWASERIIIEGKPARILGFEEVKGESRVFGNYNDYLEYSHELTISDEDPIRFWVGSPSMHFRLLKETGFKIEDFVETKAIEETKTVDPNYYARFSKLPQFTLFLATKP